MPKLNYLLTIKLFGGNVAANNQTLEGAIILKITTKSRVLQY
ncbi:hypothetical protein [Helicobacter suis]|nr:hypothetical protein [Helicobacter suis]